jgi:hypothetical protein
LFLDYSLYRNGDGRMCWMEPRQRNRMGGEYFMTMMMMCVLSIVAGVLAVVQAVVHKREQREREEIVWKACLLR